MYSIGRSLLRVGHLISRSTGRGGPKFAKNSILAVIKASPNLGKLWLAKAESCAPAQTQAWILCPPAFLGVWVERLEQKSTGPEGTNSIIGPPPL